MLFTFPSRYWSTIGQERVFSLAGWSRQLPAGFPVPRGTQGSPPGRAPPFAYEAVTPSGRPFQALRLGAAPPSRGGPATPGPPEGAARFGLLRVRSPLLAESLLFSLPPGTEMVHFPGFAPPAPRPAAAGVALPPGSPIRTPPAPSLLAAPRGFSQLAASFVACSCQGIPRAPLVACP